MFAYDDVSVIVPYLLDEKVKLAKKIYKISDKHEYLFVYESGYEFVCGYFKGNILSVEVYDLTKKRFLVNRPLTIRKNILEFMNSGFLVSKKNSIENYIVGKVKNGKNLSHKYVIYDRNLKNVRELVYKKEIENISTNFTYTKIKLYEFKTFVRSLFEKMGLNIRNFRYYFLDVSNIFYEDTTTGVVYYIKIDFYSEYLDIVSIYQFKNIENILENFLKNSNKYLIANSFVVGNEIIMI